ncbi:conserved hypothetical protein [Ricinus communis]|uniref:Uncharacterized protein n=1 Tax=Ricinus communis TaxID=3988 RepID=B9SDT1_RICCO|nr:conserved hypothetical protein [Ricinus communis]
MNFCMILTYNRGKERVDLLGKSGYYASASKDINKLAAQHLQATRSALGEKSDTGALVRTASTFRNFFSRDSNAQFPAESRRYHLYVSYACPWASRCLAYLKIKGLEQAISFTPTKSVWGRTKDNLEHMGWVFLASETEEPGAEPDPLNGAKGTRELYELASANYVGKYTVPDSCCGISSSRQLLIMC